MLWQVNLDVRTFYAFDTVAAVFKDLFERVLQIGVYILLFFAPFA